MSAPAAAFVAVGQFFSRCNVFVFLMYVALTQPVLPGSNTPGTSAADAETAKASAVARTPAIRNFFICWSPFRFMLQYGPVPANSRLHTPQASGLRGFYKSFLVRGIRPSLRHCGYGLLIHPAERHRSIYADVSFPPGRRMSEPSARGCVPGRRPELRPSRRPPGTDRGRCEYRRGSGSLPRGLPRSG